MNVSPSKISKVSKVRYLSISRFEPLEQTLMFTRNVIYLAGTHRLDIEYAEQPVSGSPFFVKAFNPAYVKVHEIKDGVVGQRSTFRGKKTYLYI